MSSPVIAALRAISKSDAVRSFGPQVNDRSSNWISNGHVAFNANLASDSDLVSLLRAAERATAKALKERGISSGSGAPEPMFENLLRRDLSVGGWSIAPAAFVKDFDAKTKNGYRGHLIRFAGGPLPGPTADLNASYLRIADLLYDGIDAFTVGGYSASIALWKRGACVGLIMPLEPGSLVPLRRVTAGKDAPSIMPRPLKNPQNIPRRSAETLPDNIGIEQKQRVTVESVARAFGGVPCTERGYEWALPTRGGTLRIAVRDGGMLDARFDEPARALHACDLSDPHKTIDCESGLLLRLGHAEALWNQLSHAGYVDEISITEKVHTAPMPIFGRRYEERGLGFPDSLPDGWRIFDRALGSWLPGKSYDEVDAKKYARHLNESSAMAARLGHGEKP